MKASAVRPSRGLITKAGPLAIAVVVATAGVLVGAKTLGVYTARGNVERAASLNGANASIIAARSRKLLEAGEINAAVPLATEALRRDPTAIAAVQAAGLAAQARGDDARAAKLLSYAQTLSRRDLQTHLWAIEHYVARGDIGRVLSEYDLALRTSLAARELLFPVLGGAVADPAVARGLVMRLKRQPLWLDAFLTFVASDGRVAPTSAVDFLKAARAAGVPAPSTGSATLVARSLDAGEFETAWAAYELMRPGVDPRRVRDPDFRNLPAEPAPFDWVLSNDGSILAQAIKQDDSGRLEIEVGSGAAGLVAQQVQMLPPGRYRLIVDGGITAQSANLTWSLTCRNGPELSKLVISGEARTRHTGSSFVVPASCDIQTLTLTADAGESPVGLRGTINHVAIVPASG